MTVMEHLRELRTRLVVSLAAFMLLSVVAFFFYNPILSVLLEPFCSVDRDLLGPQGCELIVTRPMEGFMVRLKVTAMAGLLLAAPVWLYQLWAFIVPALTPKEKRYAIPFVVTSLTLFGIGMALAYLTLANGLNFLIRLGGTNLTPFLTAEGYLDFVGLMMLGFGLTFELPLLILFLGLAEVLTVAQLRGQRRGAFVAAFLIAAVVTPSQDPYTMTALAIPLYGLYELTIAILALVMKRRRAGS